MRRQILFITTMKKCIKKMHVIGKEIEYKNKKYTYSFFHWSLS